MIHIQNQRIFLIDAYTIIFRNYFAIIKSFQNKTIKIHQYIVSSFIYFINNILEQQQPTHIIVIFDHYEKTLRHQEYNHYKSNRSTTPKAIKSSILYIFKFLKLLNIKILYKKGYEADDIIGTIAKIASIKGYKIYIVTIDKDFSQLVNHNIQIYYYYKNNQYQILGIKEICKKYKIQKPIQFIDLFSMIGDQADNIPGIPGIGKKYAQQLIEKYYTIENVFAHIHELRGKIKYNIIKYQSLGILSKKLITIITNVPIIWEEEESLFKKEIYHQQINQIIFLIKQIS